MVSCVLHKEIQIIYVFLTSQTIKNLVNVKCIVANVESVAVN